MGGRRGRGGLVLKRTAHILDMREGAGLCVCVVTLSLSFSLSLSLSLSFSFSLTHTRFNCLRCVLGKQVKPPPEGSDCTSDLSQWNHCADKRGLEDLVMKRVWDGPTISFVFYHRSHESQIKTV